ncbi:hypothetical protein [Streptomyces sp. UG1]|uniref:hypothetical protein n=1 Tax=Streptomyces sp. UG1 TaxID=3417652 RepID=UPI003CE870B4
MKIGICSAGSQRLRVHRRYGRRLYQQERFEVGRTARDVEQAVLGALRGRG